MSFGAHYMALEPAKSDSLQHCWAGKRRASGSAGAIARSAAEGAGVAVVPTFPLAPRALGWLQPREPGRVARAAPLWPVEQLCHWRLSLLIPKEERKPPASVGSPEVGRDAKERLLKGESALQRVQGIAGNEACCDCGLADPRWASINLGITLCIECSGIHR